ncbi:hypothetical protein GCM10010346_61630 [Streptomyces chryseus]|uniref:Uncharacterized protein n=1 Tax=Streptomyces chryseus TaxID=68186 RepID=A0ABQ3EBW6_9ACTN|nr:hypothetical protein GCM10010346_61630 [Streptomyces chryseus]
MASAPGPVVRPPRASGAVVRTTGSGGAHRGAVGARTDPCGWAGNCAHHGLAVRVMARAARSEWRAGYCDEGLDRAKSLYHTPP